jgi:hypothetical protein
MDIKKLGRALLFPHIALMILLIPLSAVLLVGSMVWVGTESAIAYVSYVLSAYTLTVWCVKLPRLIRFVKTFKDENRYARRIRSDPRLRINISLYGSLAWNALYGIFQLGLGYYHRTFWFTSLGTYYVILGLMRFSLLLHTRKYAPGERMRTELVKYRACGWVFLLINLALAAIVVFMLVWNRTFEHHMITAIAMAAYTFTAFTVAIVNVVKYRKYNSPVFSASKAISFAAACVSMLTLSSTMLTTFGDGTMGETQQKIMLGCIGFAVSGVVVAMAVGMILGGTKKIKQYGNEVPHGQSTR